MEKERLITQLEKSLDDDDDEEILFFREFFSLFKLRKMKGTSMATTKWGHRESTWRMGAWA
jgi:hypothetical protein